MRYVTAKAQKAAKAGFSLFGRTRIGPDVVLNEKEIMYNRSLEGDFAQRVSALGGTAYTHNEMTNLIKANRQ